MSQTNCCRKGRKILKMVFAKPRKSINARKSEQQKANAFGGLVRPPSPDYSRFGHKTSLQLKEKCPSKLA